MGTLSAFNEYLSDRYRALEAAEQALCQRQSKYESFYGEVCRVREVELGQLTDHILADRKAIPKDVNDRLDRALREASKDFDAKVAALQKEHRALAVKAEKTRTESLSAEAEVHQKNSALDQREEELKARSQSLLARIDSHNGQIQELGQGFGFFKNFFRMRRLQRQRKELEAEQTDMADRIEALRERWVREEGAHARREQELRKRWRELATEAATLQTKIDHLRASRTAIVQRTTIEKVLYAYVPRIGDPGKDDPRCPRCRQPNAKGTHFCRVCANRLVKDRPDFLGSLNEIAELNRHYESFTDGMRACQEIIALVRGLKTGIKNFQSSVSDMILTESSYPVGVLKISVPKSSVAYGRKLDYLAKLVTPGEGLHPKVFAARVRAEMEEVFTEAKIKAYFERMGQELSTQADAQW